MKRDTILKINNPSDDINSKLTQQKRTKEYNIGTYE